MGLDLGVMTNQLERVRNLLKKVTYKPGWRFDARTEPVLNYDPHYFYQEVQVFVSCLVPDTETGKDTKLVVHRRFSNCTLRDMKDSQIISYCISSLIREAEMHEMDEWFKFDGSHVVEPHPENNSKKVLDKQLSTV